MDYPTIYIDEPEDEREASRQLARLLPQLTALFSLIAEATDAHDEFQHCYHAAVLGEELSEEATERAAISSRRFFVSSRFISRVASLSVISPSRTFSARSGRCSTTACARSAVA